MTKMSSWLVEPHDPLITRDGRPFSANPGAKAYSLAFPFPSTLVGAVRTRVGQNDQGVFDTGRVEEVLGYGIRGPLLVRWQDETPYLYLPAPADAIMTDERRVHRLEPLDISDDLTNLPVGFSPVGVPQGLKGKPKGMPRYWHNDRFLAWLRDPQDHDITPSSLGIDGPVSETRTHVSVSSATGTAEEGLLFQTNAREYVQPPVRSSSDSDEASHAESPGVRTRLSGCTRLALTFDTDAPLENGLLTLGGERRLSHLYPHDTNLLPALDSTIANSIVQHKACRLVLLTPAYFEKGYLPTWLCEERHGVRATVKAVATDRPQTVSGWDYKARHAKMSRRLAPTGSVYFLSLDAENDEAIKAWLETVWTRNVSDHEQDRRDGFGLAILGTWSGQPTTFEPNPSEPNQEVS